MPIKKKKALSIKKRMDAQTNSRQKSFTFNQFATKEQKHLKINNFSSKDKYPFRDQKKYPRDKILHTKNYALFTNAKLNRPINERHVAMLADEMKKNGYAGHEAIVVDAKGNIHKGGHRHKAAQLAEVDLAYMVCDNLDMRKISEFESKNRPWTNIDDFEVLKTKEKQLNRTNYQNMPYHLLQKLMDDFNFNLSQVLAVVNYVALYKKTTKGNTAYAEFKRGNFQLTIEDSNLARKNLEKIVKIGTRFKYFKNRSFIRAILKVFEADNFVFQRLWKKIKVDGGYKIEKQLDVEAYLKEIQGIYNKYQKEQYLIKVI